MLKSVRRLFFGPPVLPGWAALQAWCGDQKLKLRATHERDGFVIEQPGGEPGWRVEWGPSQRAYLGGHELRLRGETGIDPMTYAVLMPRTLMSTLERALFSQITDSVQTRLDDDTPEEVRWLAMSPKLTAAQLGPLAPAYGAVGNVPEWVAEWLGGRLLQPLLAHAAAAPAGPGLAPAFVLVAQRSRLVLRMATASPTVPALESALALFGLALAEARQFAPRGAP